MRSSRSAQVIMASSDDLLTELLLRLPVKSLLRFKCVSKHWLSLITHPHFIARKSLKPCAASALYLNCWSPDSDGYPIFRNSNEVVPLHHPYSQTRAAYNDITSAGNPEYGIEILHSCNGLLCCRNSWNGDYRVCNPTTKCFTILPPIPVSGFHLVSGANLAFDPSKSPVYKVVCVQLPHNLCQILIYSSETGCWRVSGVPFNNLFSVDFFNGVYWNGALYWASQAKPSILMYFDMGLEILRELPLPPLLAIMYFGESCGHLHLVGHNNNSTPTQFNVHEMESDRWFVKFSIDCSGMVPSYPNFIIPILLSLVRGEKEEDSFLLMYINGQVVRYNFIRQTHSEIWNIGRPTTHNSTGRVARPFLKLRYLGPVVFQYIESLSLV